jgi:hypothetical protein
MDLYVTNTANSIALFSGWRSIIGKVCDSPNLLQFSIVLFSDFGRETGLLQKPIY